MADFGLDFDCEQDLTADLATVQDSSLALLQAIIRRLSTPRGALFYDAEYGTNITQYLNASTLPLSQIEAAIESECLKDERIQDARATVTREGSRILIDLAVTTAGGPFSLTLSADSVTVETVNS